MTLMSVSVSTLKEAEVALAGGADVIDLKSSISGAGASVIRDAVAAIQRRSLVSAAVGDFRMPPDLVAVKAHEIAAAGVDYINVDVFPGENPPAWVAELAGLTFELKLIAVFVAGAPLDLSLLPRLRASGFAGAMINALPGATGRLLDHLGISWLLGFIRSCNAAGLRAGLAGPLETPDIPRLLALAPDILGFGNVFCEDKQRTAGLDLASVQVIRALIPREHQALWAHDSDYRTFAAYGDRPVSSTSATDLVSVEDLVLPVLIGAYSWERSAPQNVRFAVSASVLRAERVAASIHDVFSYDLITDGIRMLIGQGHVALVETLAERIASLVLCHPRVTKVVVRVQKLETGSGTASVQIERAQKSTCAFGHLG